MLLVQLESKGTNKKWKQAQNICIAAQVKQIQTKSDIFLTTLRILKVSMLKKFG